MFLFEILETHFGWTRALQPVTGKNKGRYTAGQLGNFSLAPNIGSRVDREPYAVYLDDIFQRGTVWSAAGIEINDGLKRTPVILDSPMTAWGADTHGFPAILFLTDDLQRIVVEIKDVCKHLYAWRVMNPAPSNDLARSIVERWTPIDLHYDQIRLDDFAKNILQNGHVGTHSSE
jgi:hypothetical protein